MLVTAKLIIAKQIIPKEYVKIFPCSFEIVRVTKTKAKARMKIFKIEINDVVLNSTAFKNVSVAEISP